MNRIWWRHLWYWICENKT